jgi:MFS family permease
MNKSFAIGWRQVFAAMMIMACTGMITATFGVLAAPLGGEFHTSRMELMLVVTAVSLATGVLSPIAGILMDRSSLRVIMGTGLVGLIAGYVALSFATSLVQVLIVFVVFFAAAQAFAGPVSGNVLMTRWFDRRRGTALGVAISGVAGGTIFFPVLIQFLFNHFDWRDGLRVLALILFLLVAPAWALLVDRPEDRGLHPDGADHPRAIQQGAEAPALSTRDILSDPAFWLLAIIATTLTGGMTGMTTNVVPMARDLGIDATAAATTLSVFAIVGFSAKLLFAAVADRIPPRILLFVAISGFGLGMALLGLASRGHWIIFVGSALVGVGNVNLPLYSFLIPRIFGPTVVGRVGGLMSIVILLGVLSMPPIFGLIFDRTGSYSSIFFGVAGLAAISLLLAAKLRLHPRSGAPDGDRAALAAAPGAL